MLRHVPRQPFDQPLHGFDAAARRVFLVLLREARDLAAQVAGRLAVVGRGRPPRADAVQRRERIAERERVGTTLGDRHVGERRVPEDAALDVVHDVEPRPDHGVVGAEQVGARHGHVGVLAERTDDAELAIHGVRGGQQLARRLAPQHIVLPRRQQQVRRVGLPALELADGSGPAKPGIRRRDTPRAARRRSRARGRIAVVAASMFVRSSSRCRPLQPGPLTCRVNFGARFSRNAATPSRKSWLSMQGACRRASARIVCS